MSHFTTLLLTSFFLLHLLQVTVVTADEVVNIGEGTLLSVEGSSYYGTVVYHNIDSSVSAIKDKMFQAANEMGESCVGFMIDAKNKRGGLIFDMSKIKSSWPPSAPRALNSATEQWNSPWKDPLWQGKGPVSLRTSVLLNKGWNGWQCYAKLHLIAVTHVGEGTLISKEGKTWYAVMQYRNIASTAKEVQKIMIRAIVEAGDACVGYHFRPIKEGGRYLEAALLYDRSKLQSWPVSAPSALTHATVSFKAEWPGKGVVSYDLSINVDKGWNGWQCYAKSEMVYNPVVYIGEGTLLSLNGNKYYGVIQYSSISKTENGLWGVIRRAVIECGSMCVGFHYRPVNDGQYLQAALLYDRSKTGSWPVMPPPALKSASMVWTSPSDSGWKGSGSVSNIASVAAGKGWNGWQCYSFA